MRRGSGRNTGRLLLLLLCGIIIGSVLGEVLALYVDHPIFTKTVEIGTLDHPILVDLQVISILLGLTLRFNAGTVIGIIIGLILYFKS